MIEPDRKHLIYDPRERHWLAPDGTWTKAHRDAQTFDTYASANKVRQRLELEGAYGDYELYVTHYDC